MLSDDALTEAFLINEELRIKVTCNTCNCTFPVVLEVLNPENCTRELGKSITITCPECSKQQTMSERQGYALVIEYKLNSLKKQQKEDVVAMYDATTHFRTVSANIQNGSALLECTDCSKEFEVDSQRQINTCKIDEVAMVTCPHCAATTTINKETATSAAKFLMETMLIEALEVLLAKFKETETDLGTVTDS